MKSFLIIAGALALSACDSASDAQANPRQIAAGKQVFEENCLSCHGVGARGEVSDWQKPKADGKYPAPPLNGTAHAWHHSLKVLKGTVNRGGIPLGGTMPAFKDTLSEEQKMRCLCISRVSGRKRSIKSGKRIMVKPTLTL